MTRAAASGRRCAAPARLGTLLTALLMAAGCSPYGSGVTRIVDGRTQQGRYIPVTAYADYALASYMEASGEPEQAENAYLRALADDPKSAEMWTRLGALRCRRQALAGMPALDRALELAPQYEPAWRAKAACFLGAKRLSEAQKAGEEAVRLDPEQERATLLLAKIYEAQGNTKSARAWLNAWVVLHPSSDIGWTALLELAERNDDPIDQLRAHQALRLHQDPLRAPALSKPVNAQPDADALDTAIAEDDLDAARRAAVALHLPSVEIALRAYLRGNTKLAKTQAKLVVAADPSSSDARALLLLMGDASATGDLWATPDTLSPRVRKLLDEQLANFAQ